MSESDWWSEGKGTPQSGPTAFKPLDSSSLFWGCGTRAGLIALKSWECFFAVLVLWPQRGRLEATETDSCCRRQLRYFHRGDFFRFHFRFLRHLSALERGSVRGSRNRGPQRDGGLQDFGEGAPEFVCDYHHLFRLRDCLPVWGLGILDFAALDPRNDGLRLWVGGF